MDVECSHADSRSWAGNSGAKILKDERKKLISGIISERLPKFWHICKHSTDVSRQ